MRIPVHSTVRWALAAALGASMAASVQAAEPTKAAGVPMGPGTVVGTVSSYRVKAGDDVAAIATRFAVNPIRVTRPNAKTIADGLKQGEVVYIDQAASGRASIRASRASCSTCPRPRCTTSRAASW